jgi:MinD-like ATPase involved in chromosome partitioning or flagellar assembly
MIVCIQSFRSGTGKSTIAMNMASHLAVEGYRVGLVTGYRYEPDFLKIFASPEAVTCGLLDHIEGRCPLDQALYPVGHLARPESAAHRLLSDADLWLAPLVADDTGALRVRKEGLNPVAVNKRLLEIQQAYQFDYLIIDQDMHPYEDYHLLMTSIADCLLVVFRAEAREIEGTVGCVDLAKSMGVPHVMLLPNQTPPAYHPAEVIKELQGSFGVPFAGVLPFSEDVAEVGFYDVFSLLKPDHDWSKALVSSTQAVLNSSA